MRNLVYLLLAFFISISGCASIQPQYKTSGLNTKFMGQMEQPFQEYLEQTKRMIAQARTDLNGENSAKIIEAVSPFELLPGKECGEWAPGRYKNGILLIHGFTDSPYLVKNLARHFQSRCFLTRTILLPGHGTVPEDLISVKDTEWLKATEYGVFSLRNRVENMYIGGYSTGAALALHSALKHHGEFTGIFLFSPAIRINSIFSPLAGILSLFKKWLLIHAETDYAKYESIAMSGVAQVQELTKKVNKLVKSEKVLDTPTFMAVTLDDITVDAKAVIRFFRDHIISPLSRGYVYVPSPEKQKFSDKRIFAVNSFFPKERIADMSHVSLTNPPDDPHYGKHGDHANCQHYMEEPKKLKACKEGGSDVWAGEASAENKHKYVLRRLAYNPNYGKLIAAIDEFLESTKKIAKGT